MAIDGINQSDLIYEHLQTHAGFEVTAKDLVEMFTERGVAVKPGTVSALLTNMPNIALRPGVVKVRPGVYSYRPGKVAVPEKNGHPQKPGKVSSKLVAWFETQGQMVAGTAEIAEANGFITRQVSQSLNYLQHSDPRIRNVRPGVWEFKPNGAVRPSDNGAFAPVIEAIPDEVWEKVGMRVVAGTKDGDLLAIDEKGTAWAVTVTVTAKLV